MKKMQIKKSEKRIFVNYLLENGYSEADIEKINFKEVNIDMENKEWILHIEVPLDLNIENEIKTIGNKAIPRGSFKSKLTYYDPEERKILMQSNIRVPIEKIENLLLTNKRSQVAIEGELFKLDIIETRNNSNLIIMYIYDKSNSIIAKFFENNKGRYSSKLKEGQFLKIKGFLTYDDYDQGNAINVKGIEILNNQKNKRKDISENKRVELHLHTKMSAMDCILDIENVINLANSWGHKAIAITDHGVVQSFPEAYDIAKDKNIKLIYGMEGYLINDVENPQINYKDKNVYHINILVKNNTGLKNLYKLVSESHLKTFYKKPRILKSFLLKNREGLLLGSACESGELYQSILSKKDNEYIKEIIKLYDFIEIQPISNNEHLLRNYNFTKEKLIEINKKLYNLAINNKKLVVATGDVHFLNPKDKIYRNILQKGQGYKDADLQPPLYLKTTKEMLVNFEYFEKDIAEEIVIKNPNELVNVIEDLKPIPKGLYTPKIKNEKDKIKKIVFDKAYEIYGVDLPNKVEERINKELKAIIGNGFSVIYLISQKLVKKSIDNGYLVGSRGSVGSSLVATLMNITEVNPLPPHYICDKCNYVEFPQNIKISLGVDLPNKKCPECNNIKLLKEGFDIPFEVFMGLEGNKVPDIDLNFSGEFQEEIHKYTKEIFGKENVYRAGTISTIANRSAYGFVKNFESSKNLSFSKAEISRLVNECVGVKKTTGQHPGGQIIVPRDKEIYDFTPVQKPANDMESNILTTHFDFEALHDNLLKLDILGHDDPTSLKILKELTKVNPKEISLDDQEVMKLFLGTSIMDINLSKLNVELGTLGIPEFNTDFVRSMLKEAKPSSFADLVRISGLSHGEDIWLNNAQEIIKKGIANISEVISVRDDIMNYLIEKGVETSKAFKIMEFVRKGKGLSIEEEKLLKENNVPNWYIESCKKIKYMFPKAHAVAYVIMAFRIAYYKLNYPLEFYISFFNNKVNNFNIELVLNSKSNILNIIYCLREKEDKSAKDKGIIRVLEVVYEALERGIEFEVVDIYNSDLNKFKKSKEGKIIPPLITVDGLGNSAGQSLIEERNKAKFETIEDISDRTKLNSNAIETLKAIGSLKGIPESNQISLF